MGKKSAPRGAYPLCWARLGPDQRIVAADAGWRRATGSPPGGDWLEPFCSEDHPHLTRGLERVRRRGRALLMSARLKRAPATVGGVALVPEPEGILLILRRATALMDPHCEPALTRVVDALPLGVWLLRPDGRILHANPAAEALWPSAVDALAPRGRCAEGAPVRAEEWPPARALRGEVVDGGPFDVEDAAGKLRTLLIGAAPLHGPRQEIIAAVATFRDVTQLQRSRLALRENERLLRRVLDTLPVGVWFTDAAGRIVSANRAALAIWEGAAFGGPGEYGRYRGWWADSGKPIAPEEWAVSRALREGETSVDELIRIESFNGQWKYIRNSAAPLRDDAGAIVGAIIVNQDVTGRFIAERELALLADIVASTDDAVVSAGPDRRITYWNAAAERLLGYRAEEVRGHSLARLVPPDRWQQALRAFREALQGRRVSGAEFEALHKDGRRVQIALTLSPVRARSGGIVGISVVARDISERKRDQQTLQLWAQALASTHNGIVLLQDDGGWRIIFVNAAFEELTGHRAEDVLRRHPGSLLPQAADPAGLQELLGALESQRAARVMLRMNRRDGAVIWVEVSLAPVQHPPDAHRYFVAVLSDVSERVRYEAALTHRATHDTLTGLPNRALLRDHIQMAIAHARREGRHVALLFLDLDGFKHVNDTLGHDAGDLLLRGVAERLSLGRRQEDTVARLGGDEFVLLLNDLQQPEDADRVATCLLRELSSPFRLRGREVYVGASIGIAVYPQDGQDHDRLMRSADAAMYRAKQSGKNGFRFYSAELDRRAGDRLALETNLRQAVEREEFMLLFQPQRDMRSGEVVGVEALLRWNHPEGVLARPDLFLAVAEETGLIVPIGRWALRAACLQMQEWRQRYGWEFSMAVNLSGRQFADCGKLLDSIQHALDHSRLPAGRLELELTESMLMREPDSARRTLATLREAGVGLAIDDFGIGFSSLNYLRRFPVTKLKIDRAFIRDLGADPRPAALTSSIVALGHSLELTMTGEGVETDDQFRQLARTGCDQVQGYLCGRPLTPAAMVEFMRYRGGGWEARGRAGPPGP